MKEKSGIKSKRKKVPKVKEIKTANEEDDNVVMSCSRSKLMAALKLLEEKMQADKEKMQTQKIQKCKSIPGRIPGGARSTKFMPCSATYKSVQLRNALISHNWKDASLLLLNMLKDRKDQLLYRNMWKTLPADLRKRQLLEGSIFAMTLCASLGSMCHLMALLAS
ncbi:uncharacterized protein [Hetaerina americana]|uniref:uncharacterized protein isoform X2 n=1 Tax=Hetaerina americana TaxID=62018 RepID=UPI003A7F495F